MQRDALNLFVWSRRVLVEAIRPPFDGCQTLAANVQQCMAVQEAVEWLLVDI